MAKARGDIKLIVAGTITVGLAIAGMLLVQQPLKSSRPPSLGGELRPHVGEHVLYARLWEDPLEAVRRVAPVDDPLPAGRAQVTDDVDRLGPIRREVDQQIAQDKRRAITVLLVTTEGGSSGESRETRIRDRYAIGSALGIACYVPQHEDQLSYVAWRDPAGGSRVLPYEWYQEGPRKCSVDQTRAQAVLILWISTDITGSHAIAMLQRLTQAILCEENPMGNHGCHTGSDGTVLLDPTRERQVRFKIIGPRSSSAFRTLLEEAANRVGGSEGHLIWANAGGRVELYSPWATAMPRLLTQGVTVLPKPPDSSECRSSDSSRERLCWILLRAGLELKHSIGSDDRLFGALTEELERRRVTLERDAVILIAEWDSFYGRVLPVEFTAALCHRVAHRDEADNRSIEPDRLARIRAGCDTVDQAVDLQVGSPVGTRGLGLNVWRYSYLRGLDGEVSGREKSDATKGTGSTALKNALLDYRALERPVGTSQLDYMQRLADRIERDMAEVAQAAGDAAQHHNPVAAVGILGSDAYDALLILQALRDRFPGAIFFTTDLDSRLVYADDYRWTRNLVTASHYGLELYGMLQRDVPPFRSSYQTAAYFATLRALGHVQALAVCPPEGASLARDGVILSPCGYRAHLTGDHVWFSALEAPRLYEVGRHGAVDLTVGAVEQGYTIHAPRVDLAEESPQTNARRPSSGLIYGLIGFVSVVGFVVSWIKPGCNRWIMAHAGRVVLGAVGILAVAIVVDQFLLSVILERHDGGEPFYWLEGVSVWPTELLRGLAAGLAIMFLIKGWRDLRINLDEMTARYGFVSEPERPHAEGWRRYLTTAAWVLSPGGEAGNDVGEVWSRYREAATGSHRLPRICLLVFLYAGSFMLLWMVLGAEDFSGPCRGAFSCRVDAVMAWGSYLLAAVLNLFVFDAVLLCRRWIRAVAITTQGWPKGADARLKLQSAENLGKARELLKIDMIAHRTDLVNRLVRYPFIVLLVMMVARNHFFDDWHFPLTMVVGWLVNVLLAVAAALLLYRAAEAARAASIDRLNQQLLQGLDRGAVSDSDVKLTKQVIEDIEGMGQGAFVPLWQQPVVESSFYGALAMLQYLYLS